MLTQLRGEEPRYIRYVLKNDDNRVHCIILRSVIMIRICQMLEKSQEIGDALDLVGDLGVVQLFHPRHYGR